ncbi:hypothetical protein BCIN_06g03040 [Botrytis cinerea B05.10]|uniref:Uncharacterized protein n=1 Tax=Botryotinia fuckeliana (strain B05.10) TaxID=332648 RepID=A0A384JJR1_BOTFB|nr:hypothetical protein BCIN_06g03040 [Botrytis cinerea B05.10]ATZ50825.1 hypothetical protein BCIN_06g03040 [Botrytis cinerea B05.10]
MDCKSLIRRYVLVAQPSKWAQPGHRVVVQSPVLNIANESLIPVRRFEGKDENSVCFMPVQDIEKDGSIAYKNLGIAMEATQMDAHGMAWIQSDSEFDYQPGDRFWLFITAKGDDYENNVPVINLRTMETGSVPISHVCWFPKMRGPGNEVWTFGGNIRKLKLHGRNNFTLWIWGICQYLDGQPATTRYIQVPEKNVDTDEQQWLKSSNAESLFSHIYKSMTKDCQQIISPVLSPLRATNCSILPKGLHTPPISPCMGHPRPLNEDTNFTPRLASTELNSAWKNIMNLASKGTPRPIRSSLIHPQRILSSPDRRKFRRTDVNDSRSGLGHFDSTARSSNRSPSLTMENSNFRVPNDDLMELLADRDGGGIRCALRLLDWTRKQVEESRAKDADHARLSAAHPLLRSNPTILFERYQTKRNLSAITELCDRGKDDCEWSLRFTSKHHHPDQKKCTITKKIREHEHCISSLRPLPSRAGPCLLIEGAQEHQCCTWDDKDTKDLSVAVKEFDNVKIMEAKDNCTLSDEKGIEIPDQFIDESKKIKEEKWIPPHLFEELYDGEGKWLRDELDKGNFHDEILELEKMQDGEQDQGQNQEEQHPENCLSYM